MDSLLPYIGPISLVLVMILYSLLRSKRKTEAKKQLKTQCPKCQSSKLAPYRPKKTRLSRRAGIIGYAINNAEGAMFAMLYEADRTYYRCRYCGHRFSKKENRFIPEPD